MSDKKDKKLGNSPIIQVNQGNNSISIIGTTAPVDLNINQTLYAHNDETTIQNKNESESNKASSNRKEWPDPKEFTIADVWTKEDGTFCLSTKTEGKFDGKIEFPLNSKKEATNQMKLMMLLCSKYPDGVSVYEIIREIYPSEVNELRKNPENAKRLLKTASAIPSDVRKKLRSSNINPDIISPLGVEATKEDKVTLLVKYLNKRDEIVEEKFNTKKIKTD